MINGLHHNAYRCRDSEETRQFYEEFLGLPLVNAFEIGVTKTGRKTSVLHSFYQMGDGSFLAFFEAPGYPFEFKDQHDFDLHIALEVDHETLHEMFARGKEEGIETRGIGYVIELTARTESDDLPLDEARRGAREALDAWQTSK
jgi:catechol 2,3-dioxygenase-like lactoylglutathione lyase family enzyme